MHRIRFLFVLACLTPRLAALDLYVAPTGRDTNSGTSTAPFATITRARDAIRLLKTTAGLPADGVRVFLQGGTYNLTEPLVFDARDSGTGAASIAYLSQPGDPARLTGGRNLDPAWFALVDNSSAVWSRLDPAARGKVYAANLRDHGITDFGSLRPRGFGLQAPAPLEFFVDGRAMTLAQWPNRDDPLARTTTAVSNTQVGFEGSRPERWTQAPDAWLHGFWAYAWADFHLPLAGVDVTRKILSFATAPAQYGTAPNRPYYVYNLIEELDQPNEYYLDRKSGILYFWPAKPLTGTSLQVSMLEAPLVQLKGTQHLTLSDLVIEASRGPLLTITDANESRLFRCLLRNGGQFALQVTGVNSGLDSCEVTDCGEDGVILGGGDRATLRSAGNYVVNSRIHRVGGVGWTYKPGIRFDGGVGNRAAHNLIDDLPHAAILFGGNNHLIEFNEIRRVCQETSDAGAIYAGRNWGFRGNVIRYNYLHHIESVQDGDGAHGVYLDDCMSGVEVFGNVFYRVANAAVFCGGGRDNNIHNNIIALSGLAHYNDDRGRQQIDNTPGSAWNLLERLSDDGVRYQTEPWASAYPTAAAIPNSWSAIRSGLWRNPQGSSFVRNAGWGNSNWMFESNSSGTGVFSAYSALAENDPGHRPLFDENGSLDRAARPLSLAASIPGFEPIAFRDIGTPIVDQASVSRAPDAVELVAHATSPVQIDLTWTDYSNLPAVQEAGFEVQQMNPDGSWRTLQAVGSDVNFASVKDLAPATLFTFRIRAFNAVGSSFSEPIAIATQAANAIAGSPTRIEVENVLNIVNDTGSLGTVGVSDGALDSNQSVRLYDVGDAIRVPLSVPSSGPYRIGVRVRTGGANAPTTFWPDGYRFKLDGSAISLTGDKTTLSSLDSAYGGCYWGTMIVDTSLTSGVHWLEIASASAWTVVDYVEIAPLVAAPVSGANQAQAAASAFRVEAEGAFVVANDVGGFGSVGVSDGQLDSGASVRLYDVGDAIRIVVAIPSSGTYRFGCRVRSGGTTGATGFWPDGYRFKLDGNPITFVGDPPSVSALDPAYGGCFWGTMQSGSLVLAAGPHTLEIAAASSWAVVDYLDVLPLGGDQSPSKSVATAPVLTVPTNITIEANNPKGAMATFSPTARDSAGNFLSVTSFPASGSYFPLGSTGVNLTAVDAAGRVGSGSFVITVQDTTAPTITVPADFLVEATNKGGAIVTFTSSATDAVDGNVSTSNRPESGSLFPFGTSVVTATAIDKAGNSSSKTFHITVTDSVAPVLSVPANMTVAATSPAGALVTYLASALDNLSGVRSTTSTPASGSLFPVGTTTVTARAEDMVGNVATKPFMVTVTPPAPSVPTGLSATAFDREVDLEWNAPSFAASYTIRRATASGGPFATIANNLTASNFSDSGLNNGTTYYYAVSATGPSGQSAFSGQVSATPAPREGDSAWTSSDVGPVELPGRATIENGGFKLEGAGADIWGTTDAFHYVYQTLKGDGSITVRVSGLENTDGWAKAGIMIRESLRAGARFAGLYVTPEHGSVFQWRADPDQACSNLWGENSGAPYWLSLTRRGATIVAQVSADGVHWSLIGSTDIAMEETVFLGLALTSHQSYRLAHATLDNVTLAGTGSETTIARVEAETAMQIVNDVGVRGSVGLSDGEFDSGQSVRLYDAGDSILVPLVVPQAGSYRIGVRVRSGGSTGPTGFWPNGYGFRLDGNVISLLGATETVSNWDAAYGGCFWGTMRSNAIYLSPGEHKIVVTALTPWAVVDFVELIRIN